MVFIIKILYTRIYVLKKRSTWNRNKLEVINSLITGMKEWPSGILSKSHETEVLFSKLYLVVLEEDTEGTWSLFSRKL